MNKLLLRLLGIDPAVVPPDLEATPVLTNANLLASWRACVFVGVVAALVWVVFWLYRHELLTCPRRMRLILAVIRSAVLLVLAAVLLGPALAISVRQQLRPHVLVMLDASASMAIRDRYLDDEAVRPVSASLGRTAEQVRADPPRRSTIVNHLLTREDHQFLRQLAGKGQVMMATFAESVNSRQALRSAAREATEPSAATTSSKQSAGAPHGRSADSANARAEPLAVLTLPDEPAGEATNLAAAIRDGLKTVSGDVAAIILFTDGQHTVRHDEVRDAARAAKAQGVPVFPVGIGDPTRPRNLEVAEVVANDPAWRGDPLEIRAILRHHGLEQAGISVELAVEPMSESGTIGPRTVVERRSLTLAPDPVQEPDAGSESSVQQTVTFNYTPQQAGQYRFTVRVPPLGEEQEESDNEQLTLVQVLSEKARVLLIAGAPSWEYRFVQAMLRREKSIDVSCWLQTMDPDVPQEGDTVIQGLPRTEAELFQYDLVMMFDPNPIEFNEAWIEALKTFLGKHGGGFLFVAGPQYTVPLLSGFRTRGIRSLLPVDVPDDLTSLDVQAMLETNARGWPPRAVPANLDQPIMAFDSDMRANAQRWSHMPPVYWSFPASRARPAARVLLEHSDPSTRRGDDHRPLLVIGQYGPGRTAYLGFNSTWRWRRLGQDTDYFNKFWIQTIRFLVEGRLLKGKRRGYLEIPGEEFLVGDRINVRGQFYDRSYQELRTPVVPLELRGGDGTTSSFELKAAEGKAGWYAGVVPASAVGFNELVVKLEGDEPGRTIDVTRRFRVRVPDAERRQTRLNKALLVEVASLSGGKYADVSQLDAIPTAITREPVTLIVPSKPIELWSTDRLMLLLVALLATEWALRKRYRLL